MKAIILNLNDVVGWHPEPDIEQFDSTGVQYELVEEIPDIIANTPEGHYVARNDLGEYELLVYQPEPTPPDRISYLVDEAAELALELIGTQIRLEKAESDSAWLVLELVNKGVL